LTGVLIDILDSTGIIDLILIMGIIIHLGIDTKCGMIGCGITPIEIICGDLIIGIIDTEEIT
tara:strand:- start:195 stop:380 length:186 start_codon:yes stop_codon:yes gene_type:complete